MGASGLETSCSTLNLRLLKVALLFFLSYLILDLVSESTWREEERYEVSYSSTRTWWTRSIQNRTNLIVENSTEDGLEENLTAGVLGARHEDMQGNKQAGVWNKGKGDQQVEDSKVSLLGETAEPQVEFTEEESKHFTTEGNFKGPCTSPEETGFEKDPRPGITAANLDCILHRTADANKELIVTTVAGRRDSEEEMLWGITAFNLNFVGHLQKLNLSNYLIIGVDDMACQGTLEAGIPCWRDDMGWELDGEFNRGRQVALKWFYLREIVARGYHPLWLDNDAAVLQNPFEKWERNYDIQTLSDGGSAQDWSELAEGVPVVCPVDKYYDWHNPAAPCSSTGIMFLRASPEMEVFLTTMVDLLAADPYYWEQKMFQVEIVPFIVDSYDEVNRLFDSNEALDFFRAENQQTIRLRFRQLPLKSYHNINTLRLRREQGLRVDSIIGHCGFIHWAHVKIAALYNENMWIGETAFRSEVPPDETDPVDQMTLTTESDPPQDTGNEFGA